jgi:DNA-binding MarR family transcriptional regulator
LGERLSLTSGSVTALIDRLEAQAWAVRERHPGDRRKVVVKLTAAAHDIRRRELAPLVEAIEHTAAQLPGAERDTVVHFLSALTSAAAHIA